MSRNIKHYGKRLALAAFILAAGCSYSCGRGQKGTSLSQIQESTDDRKEGWESQDSQGGLAEEKEVSSCFVHVCGEVENPGVYELREGQRVYEAVNLAGGFTSQAAESYLNLAEPVKDGMKLEVPSRDQASDPEWAKAAGEGESSAKVNLNKAAKEELMTLKGIGEARAEDIIRYREEQGGFSRIEDVMNVPGIKDAAFQKIKEDITV